MTARHGSKGDRLRLLWRMALLAIPGDKPATLQYPHALEHEGRLWVTFSRNKAQSEILGIPLAEINALRGK